MTINTTGVQDKEVRRQARAEYLAFLSRTMPGAALGHSLAAALVLLALHGVVAVPALVGWCFAVILVSLLRVLLTR
ncbi:MAG: hypothetical protein ACR2PJ_07210, partial [Pseudomonadales bacterium]